MASDDLLDVVNEAGEVIGMARRDEVHQKGMLHKEVHVWLVTPKGEIVFQHRSTSKDTYPDLLDASIGGHVDAGWGWLDTAVKEAKEEAGIACTEDALHFVQQLHVNVYDPVTKMTNNCLRNLYVLHFNGSLDTLKVENGEATHFEMWPIGKLAKLTAAQKSRFIPSLLGKEYQQFYKRAQAFVGANNTAR